jgi:hypothetical protein
MKKSISLIIIGILVLSGISVVALPATTHSKLIREQQEILLSNLQLSETIDYTIINLDEATSTLHTPGQPTLPVVTKIFTYPFDTTIESVKVTFSDPQEIDLTKPIQPASEPIPLNMEQTLMLQTMDQTVYTNDQLYPKEQFTYKVHVGLQKGIHTIFVAVHCYPIQYNPLDNQLFYSNEFEITVDVTHSSQPTQFGDSYDLVILAPEQFSTALQPLVDHKNDKGVATTLITLETIISSQTGRDDAEKVKYYIKEAVEELGVTYVLIVGGMKGQQYQWLFPVRYTNNHAGASYEYGVLSDLYYSDIYKYEGNTTVFDDWDSNGNDVFAEFSFSQKDILDLVPDVFVGRLPCRTLAQVETSVVKLITYENTKADPSWFKNLLLIAGDTYQDSPGGLYEGELANDYSASFMTDFTPIRLWGSNGALTGQKSVEDAINTGAGFVHMAGHANPGILITHPPQDNAKITILRMYHLPLLDFIGYLGRGKIDKAIESLLKPRNPRLTNAYKLPVVVIGGCHNSQFNTTLLNIFTMKPFFTRAYGYGEYVPKCFSWFLTNLENGGAIAAMGNTGLGMGYHDAGYTTGLDGWLMPQFFKHYGTNNEEYIGAAHSYAIRDYALNFDCNTGDADRQMLEQWPLMGDPSMLIGGYE